MPYSSVSHHCHLRRTASGLCPARSKGYFDDRRIDWNGKRRPISRKSCQSNCFSMFQQRNNRFAQSACCASSSVIAVYHHVHIGSRHSTFGRGCERNSARKRICAYLPGLPWRQSTRRRSLFAHVRPPHPHPLMSPPRNRHRRIQIDARFQHSSQDNHAAAYRAPLSRPFPRERVHKTSRHSTV